MNSLCVQFKNKPVLIINNNACSNARVSIILNLLKKFRKVIRVLGVSNPPSFPVLRVLDYIFEQCDKCV